MKFYMHAGSFNHGCEAIVRSTIEMQDDEVELFSEHPEEDIAVHLDKVCNIKLQGGKRSKTNPLFILCKAVELLLNNKNAKHWYAYKNLVESIKPGELCVSIGGDNYCYGANQYLIYLNRAINQRGGKTGLWGCSIEPDVLRDPEIIEDMKRYSFISARETITYQALKDAGLSNIHLYPDPAFTLKMEECELPISFGKGDVVGINLSPLVQKLDRSGTNVFDNYKKLISYILEETNLHIVLIPHVCKVGNDDREAMRLLMAEFPDQNRIIMVNEDGKMNCMQLKYIISKCRFLVAARTHASIAAYSTCVPTLVVGYSVKAKGIAKDLFGSWESKVIDISTLKSDCDLLNFFRKLEQDEELVKEHLCKIMPEYISDAGKAEILLMRGII